MAKNSTAAVLNAQHTSTANTAAKKYVEFNPSEPIISICSLTSSSQSDSDSSSEGSRKYLNCTNATHDLLDFADEEIDEIFFFKCPMLVWSEDKKEYVVSPNDDNDEQGNQAIQ